MSLAALNWRYVGTQSFGSGTVAAALDALFTLGTATTYADGTTRTEGSGSAWTFTGKRYQNATVTECLYPNPPTDTLTQRVLFAGQASGGTKTPTMAAPDTSATVVVMGGIVKNAGAFNAWDNANPMTSGTFSGYWRVWPGSAGSGNVYLYESQEALLVLFSTTAGGVYGILVGAFIDPESSDTTNDAESDGKLYGLMTGGVISVINTSWSTTGGAWTDHGGTASNPHFAILTPGGSALITCERLVRPNTAMTASGLKTRSGRFARQDFGVRATAAAPNDQAIGRMREIFFFTDGQTPSKQTNAGTTIGYLVAASTSTTADTLFLLH